MGITPITNLIPLPVARSIQAELDPLPLEPVENSARTREETYSPSNGKSARGSEDDALEDEHEDLGDKSADESNPQPGIPGQPRPISFFA
jgi:hypothetical protein